jgi:hypothetical protein
LAAVQGVVAAGRTVGYVLLQYLESASGGMVNVVLAVGEGFAREGVFGMIEHRFKRLFNLLP